MSSTLGEPETSRLSTENIPSISDKDFSELSEKIEKSVRRRIKDAEVGQKEILRMIENLSSKIDSLSDKTPPTTNTKAVEPDLPEPGPTSQREDVYELPQSQGQHMVTGVFPQTEIPPRSSGLPAPTRNIRTTKLTNCLNRSEMSPNRTSDFPGYRRHCQQPCPPSTDEMTKSSISKTSS